MKFEVGKLYYIEWEDHWSSSPWKDLTEINRQSDFIVCRSIGWCIKDTDKVVILAASQDELTHSDVIVSGNTMGRLKSCIVNAYEIVGV